MTANWHAATDAAPLLQQRATKSDLAGVKAELKADVAAVKADLTADLAAVRAEQKADGVLLRSEMAALGNKLRAEIADSRAETLKWLIGLLLVQGGLIVGLLRLLPGH